MTSSISTLFKIPLFSSSITFWASFISLSSTISTLSCIIWILSSKSAISSVIISVTITSIALASTELTCISSSKTSTSLSKIFILDSCSIISSWTSKANSIASRATISLVSWTSSNTSCVTILSASITCSSKVSTVSRADSLTSWANSTISRADFSSFTISKEAVTAELSLSRCLTICLIALLFLIVFFSLIILSISESLLLTCFIWILVSLTGSTVKVNSAFSIPLFTGHNISPGTEAWALKPVVINNTKTKKPANVFVAEGINLFIIIEKNKSIFSNLDNFWAFIKLFWEDISPKILYFVDFSQLISGFNDSNSFNLAIFFSNFIIYLLTIHYIWRYLLYIITLNIYLIYIEK